MPKFLFQASYSIDGVKGVLKEGGSGRQTAIEKVVAGLGGHLEGFYFAFGGDDVFVIADLPDQESAAALGLTVNATAGARVKTVVLLTPDQIDEAARKTIDYRPPGA